MPKDNEVDEKADLTEPVGYSFPNTIEELARYRDRGMDSAYGLLWAMPGEGDRAREPLYSAATVAELRAEVERRKDALAAMSQFAKVAEQRADAAERRVGELEKLMAAARRAIGDHHAPNDCYATGPLTGDAFLDLVQCPACAFLDQYANSTKVTP